jgi:hypothetical protein
MSEKGVAPRGKYNSSNNLSTHYQSISGLFDLSCFKCSLMVHFLSAHTPDGALKLLDKSLGCQVLLCDGLAWVLASFFFFVLISRVATFDRSVLSSNDRWQNAVETCNDTCVEDLSDVTLLYFFFLLLAHVFA